MIKAVIFDMDGVLVNSEPVIAKAAILGLMEYGVNAKEEDFLPFVGSGEDMFIGGVARKYGKDYILEMKDRVYDIYDTIVKDEIRLINGVFSLLNKLKEKGYLLALASSADKRKVISNLAAAGISYEYFSVIMTGEDVVNKKPHPDIYIKTADKLGLRPDECVVIEDAENGVKAAKNAGIRCFGVTSSFSGEALKNAGANEIFIDLNGICEYFDDV